jgi:hypothetical protein
MAEELSKDVYKKKKKHSKKTRKEKNMAEGPSKDVQRFPHEEHETRKDPEEPSKDVQRFLLEEHDVSCCLEILFCGGSTLILGEEDAELIRTSLAGLFKHKKRGPYGELGTVDSTQFCCFYGFAAASLMFNEQDIQCTGCGCEQEKVNAIVAELKKRQAMRGDRAKTRMAESTLESISLLHKKMDAIMEKLGFPPVTAKMER